MTAGGWKLVTFDIDGTLTLVHGWSLIAERFGRTAAYERTTARIARGEIGEDEHLASLLSLAIGHSVGEVEAVLEATPTIAHIGETVRALRSRGIRSAILSHNPPYVCGWYARTFGFDDYEGCEVPPPVEGRIPPPGSVRAEKPDFLRRLLRRVGEPAHAVLHVGDSLPDLAVFAKVGGGVALNSPIAEVRRGADAVIDSEDLRDLLPVVDRLTPHPAQG